MAFVSPGEPGQSEAFEPSPEQEEIINQGVIETVTKIEGVVALGGDERLIEGSPELIGLPEVAAVTEEAPRPSHRPIILLAEDPETPGSLPLAQALDQPDGSQTTNVLLFGLSVIEPSQEIQNDSTLPTSTEAATSKLPALQVPFDPTAIEPTANSKHPSTTPRTQRVEKANISTAAAHIADVGDESGSLT